MKREFSILLVIFLFSSSILLSGIDIQSFTEPFNSENVVLNANGDSAFEQIHGAPGHIALAISEVDNLLFTNAPEGIAFVQLDDFTNQTNYKDEIGLTEVTISNIEVDPELKLLYIGSVMGVDILNYSQYPLQASPLLTGISTNFELGDFIDIDPVTHYAWIVTQSHGLRVYNPFTDSFADISGYNPPAASVDMLTVDVNSSEALALIGSKEGLYRIDTSANSTQWITTAQGLPHNYTRVVKAYPSIGKAFVGTQHPQTEVSGGLSVIYLENNTVETFNWTTDPYNPRSIIDVIVKPEEDIGFIASFVSTDAEFGLLVFNTTDMSGIAKSLFGSSGGFGPPQMSESPEYIDGLLAEVEIDETTGDIIVGTVQRVQRIEYTYPTTAFITSSPIQGMHHNYATDLVYDPVDDKIFVSTLLGLDRVDPYTHEIEYLVPPTSFIGGAGGDTSGALAVTDRFYYHHNYEYDIVGNSYTDLKSIVPLEEYGYITDITVSHNESLVFYSTAQQAAGYSDNGSLIIFNRQTRDFYLNDFGYNVSELEVNEVVEDPTRDVLYVATNQALIVFNLTTQTVISRHGEGSWEVQSLEWIDGKLWMGMEPYPNVRIFDPLTETTSSWDKASEILYPAIREIYYLPARNETYICAHSGLYVLNRTNNVLKYESEAEGLSTLFVGRMTYVPTTDEAWIGSFQGINIYDPDYDTVNPYLNVILYEIFWSGTVYFDVYTDDYSGIKELKITIYNNTWSQSFSYSNVASYTNVSVDSTMIANGVYTLEVNSTDYYDQTSTSTTGSISIYNEVIPEFTTILSILLLPALAGTITYLLKKKIKQ